MKIWPAPDPKTSQRMQQPAGRLPFASVARDVLLRAVSEFVQDDIMTIAAAATFYILLGFFPAVAAFVSLYGLFADVHTVRAHLSFLTGFLPSDVLRFVGNEMTRLATGQPSKLSGTFFLGLAFSIWSANAGVMALIAGLNVAYEERETRGPVVARLVSLAITVSVLVVSVGAVFLFLALPVMQSALGLPSLHLLREFRWPIIYCGTLIVLCVMYAYGTSGKPHPRRRVLPGALFASTIWLGGSFGSSWYVANLAHYARTYGSLATIVGFLMWIWLGLMIGLFGAELNCELGRVRPK